LPFGSSHLCIQIGDALREAQAGQFPHTALVDNDILRADVEMKQSLGGMQVTQCLSYL
jgi:hypothetical protein